jgi:hypothetical protein
MIPPCPSGSDLNIASCEVVEQGADIPDALRVALRHGRYFVTAHCESCGDDLALVVEDLRGLLELIDALAPRAVVAVSNFQEDLIAIDGALRHRQYGDALH